MGQYANDFRSFLTSIGLDLEEGRSEEKTFFAVEQTIKGGPKVRIAVVFDDDDYMISLLTFNYVCVDNPTKKEYILSLINDLNIRYTYFKFVLDESNNVGLSYHLIYDDGCEPKVILRLVKNFIEVLETEYSRFMRIIWS